MKRVVLMALAMLISVHSFALVDENSDIYKNGRNFFEERVPHVWEKYGGDEMVDWSKRAVSEYVSGLKGTWDGFVQPESLCMVMEDNYELVSSKHNAWFNTQTWQHIQNEAMKGNQQAFMLFNFWAEKFKYLDLSLPVNDNWQLDMEKGNVYTKPSLTEFVEVAQSFWAQDETKGLKSYRCIRDLKLNESDAEAFNKALLAGEDAQPSLPLLLAMTSDFMVKTGYPTWKEDFKAMYNSFPQP